MTCYIVTLDVFDAARRNSLKERLKSFGPYCPVHENCWAIVTDKSATQVRDYLMEITTATDRVFIVKSGAEAAWTNTYGEENSTWLKEKL